MIVSHQCAGAYNINIIAFWLLLLLYPAKVSSSLTNCSCIEGHILDFVCLGSYDRELRLLYKDRHPALNTPYAIWQRADYLASKILLIVFYEGALTNCYNLVYSDGKFYCNGRNYPVVLEGDVRINCLPFPFSYTDELHKKCHRASDTHAAKTISSVIIYMESNIIVGSSPIKELPSLQIFAVLILFIRLTI